jgi:hypothetical protein
MTELSLTDQILLLTNDDQIVQIKRGYVLDCSTLTDLIEASPLQDPRKDPLPVEQSKQSIDLFFEFVEFRKSPKYSKEKLKTNKKEIMSTGDYLGYKSATKLADLIDAVLRCNLKLFISSFDKTLKNNNSDYEKPILLHDDNLEDVFANKNVISDLRVVSTHYYVYLQIQQNHKSINLTLSGESINKDLIYYKNTLESICNPEDTYFQAYIQCSEIGICGPFEEDIYKIEGKDIHIRLQCSRDHLKTIIELIYRTCIKFKDYLEKIKG